LLHTCSCVTVNVCVYVCMYVRVRVCTYACMRVHNACNYVSMLACNYLCVCSYIGFLTSQKSSDSQSLFCFIQLMSFFHSSLCYYILDSLLLVLFSSFLVSFDPQIVWAIFCLPFFRCAVLFSYQTVQKFVNYEYISDYWTKFLSFNQGLHKPDRKGLQYWK
jgi:hypothetical protein